MDIEAFRNHCIGKPGVTEELPFGPETLVFKVAGKMFALCNLENFESINLKCDPELAIELRERYHAVQPGYHMNKKHWNTVAVDDDLSTVQLIKLIDQSYELVINSLTKKQRESLNGRSD